MDKVRPSTKYYYTFRTFNEFGSYSNPTPVYEVEVLKDANDVKVVVNIVRINTEDEDEEPQIDLIKFKKKGPFRMIPHKDLLKTIV